MFYIMYGQDDFSLHEEFTKLKAGLGNPEMLAVNTSVLDGKQLRLNQLKDACNTTPFLHDVRLVIVEGLLERFEPEKKPGRRSSKPQSKSDAELQEWQELGSYVKKMPETTVLALIGGELDARRNGLLKHIISLAEVKTFPKLGDKALRQWVKKRIAEEGGQISDTAINLLVELVGSDLWSMKSEIDKLLIYKLGQPITENDVRQVTSYAREANIFAFVDAILDGRKREAQQLLHRLLLDGVAPPHILTMVTRQLRLTLMAKELSPKVPKQEAMGRLGINKDWLLEKLLRQARVHTLENIKRAYHQLLEADVAMKTGKYDGDLALELLLMDLCKT